jgi:hypothetical protein
MGWEPLLASWLQKLPPPLEIQRPKLHNLIMWLVPPCLEFVTKECEIYTITPQREIAASTRIASVHSLLRLLDAMFLQLSDGESAPTIFAQVHGHH